MSELLVPVLSERVARARAEGRPIVALESTLITHGLSYPDNLTVARAAEAAVRESGAEPATVAVAEGALKVGLTERELELLAHATGVSKASRHTLAAALVATGWAATTVSGTMIAARLAGITVFATGGIGGVHRGAQQTFDISADLEELARTPVVVVCSGPKAILDRRLTLEYLETRGVPVVALGVEQLAGFYSRDSGLRAPISLMTPREVALLVAAHWRLPSPSGVVVAVPVPQAEALPFDDAERAVARAVAEAEREHVDGPELTPWLLARVADITDGRSVRANKALIENNARIAAQIAVAMSTL